MGKVNGEVGGRGEPRGSSTKRVRLGGRCLSGKEVGTMRRRWSQRGKKKEEKREGKRKSQSREEPEKRDFTGEGGKKKNSGINILARIKKKTRGVKDEAN